MRPKYGQCIDCHKDYHNGQFAKSGVPQDCKDCHTIEGFFPSRFTIERHAKLKFPLVGSHLAIPCEACHKSKENLQFRFASLKCIQCHENIHDGKISAKFIENNRCEKCHSEESWSSITFDHTGTKFELLGKHKQLSCRECHFDPPKGKKFEQKFIGLNTECNECHKDIHFQQFEQSGKTDCERCHNFNNWEPVKFDHSTSKFPLDGAHQKVLCGECHKRIVENGNEFIKFKIEKYQCKDCHS